MVMHEAAMFFRLEISYCQVGCQRLEPTEKDRKGSLWKSKGMQDRNARGENFCPNKLGIWNVQNI